MLNKSKINNETSLSSSSSNDDQIQCSKSNRNSSSSSFCSKEGVNQVFAYKDKEEISTKNRFLSFSKARAKTYTYVEFSQDYKDEYNSDRNKNDNNNNRDEFKSFSNTNLGQPPDKQTIITHGHSNRQKRF